MIPGWYGKIPATGDFVARRVPATFSEAWDRWLLPALAASRERLGAGWQETYLSMPAWRFVLAPGVATESAWAGAMVPSVDAVGRFFPLTIVAEPQRDLDPVASLFAATRWLDAIEAIALRSIAPRASVAQIDAELARHPFRAESPAGARRETTWVAGKEMRSAWLTEESEVLERSLLLCDGLPAAGQYCAMMDGRFSEHGWVRRDLATERS